MIIEVLRTFYTKGKRRGNWYWRFKASNGQILAHSETYKSKRNCLDTVKKVAYRMRVKAVILK